MPRHFLQRWSVVLLLVSRLIFGELAHSAPHDAPVERAAVAQSDQEPCTDHVDEEAAAAQLAASTAGTHHVTSQDTDCCKATACECACVHISALAPPPVAPSVVLVDQGRLPVFAPGLAQQRPSALFRPPA